MSAAGKILAIAGGIAVTAGIIWWFIKQAEAAPPTTPAPTVPEYHYECIKDKATGLIMCGAVEGKGINQCDPYGSPEMCWSKIPCSLQSECGTGARCWNGKCYWTANEYLDWDGTHTVTKRFNFDKRIIGNKLLGELGFTLDAWNVGCGANVKIYLIRDGKRVKTIYDQVHADLAWAYGTPVHRADPIATFFTAEAVDGIEFECKCVRGFPFDSFSEVLTNIHTQFIFV